ncbi:MAG: ABC transporter permease [Verrucomicrobiota bacterium]|nr:ABC transporter permease [Verrucomicrobiota bacterium]
MNGAAGTFTRLVHEMGAMALLASEAGRSLCSRRWSLAEAIRQLHHIGVQSQAVVLTTGAFTGMVLCAQTYFQFHKVKMDTAALSVVGVSMASELGPVLAGLMVAGRVGAAITAELGTMRVTEQIDALRTMAVHPVDHLVVPRLSATLAALPLLTIETVAIGIGAAHLVGTHLLGIEAAYSWHHMLYYTDPADLAIGLIKAILFGGLIALIACHRGLTCDGGAEGVGRATNTTVVHACIAILISNFFLTLLLNAILT